METQETNNEPIIADMAMKMPEEGVGAAGTENTTAHLGAILGVLIVVLILILGGLYLWWATLQTPAAPAQPTAMRPTAAQNKEPETPTAQAYVDTAKVVSPSNDVNAIAADVNSTNINGLSADMNSIDSAVNAGASATSSATTTVGQ